MIYLAVSEQQKTIKTSTKFHQKKKLPGLQILNARYEKEFNTLKNEFEKNKTKINSSHGDQQTLADGLENFIHGCDELLIDNNTLIRKTLAPEKEEKNISQIEDDLKERYNSVFRREIK